MNNENINNRKLINDPDFYINKKPSSKNLDLGFNIKKKKNLKNLDPNFYIKRK
jgi:hypothetical protein